MTQEAAVIVKEFPDRFDRAACRSFLRELGATVAELYRPVVVFDLSRVQQLTSRGVDLLLACLGTVTERDGELRVAGASPETSLVLELTQLGGLLATYDSVEDALSSADSGTLLQASALARSMQPLPVAEAA
jgi:anti-sigma B factor antagonist